MNKTIKKVIAVAGVTATMFSVAAMSASALTRRMYGDVNGDGVISEADVELIQRYSMGMGTFDEYQKIAADVNGDSEINLMDAYMVYILLAGRIDGFPVGDYFVY